MTVPVLLLDIDGVVNALWKDKAFEEWPEEEWLSFAAEYTVDNLFPMLVAKPVVRFINKLHVGELVEVRWHSTWRHRAKLVGKLAGFEDFGVTEAPEFDDYRTFQLRQIRAKKSTWWKLPAAERVVQEEKRPLIWLDDDIHHEYLRRPDADESLGGEQRTLLIRPDKDTGLITEELRRVLSFAEEVGEWL